MPTPVPAATTSAAGPLAGVRVLDLTSVVLGPLATQILGDFGADVIKVESLEGDLIRSNGVSKHPGMSSIFLAINRNKRSVAVDLKSPAGLDLVKRLAAGVDVVVHNMRVAAIERLGLGYAAVQAINPRVVYCVATGFGQDGPDAGRPAFDDVIQAASGLAALIGHERGIPEFVPALIADKTTGMAVVNAVLAALFHRERHGSGQYVEVPMLETMAAFTLAEHLGGLTFDPPTARAGYARILAGGRKPVATRDGHVAMLPYTEKHWMALFDAAGRADLARKYNFADRQERNARIVEIYADLNAVIAQMTTAECLALCDRVDIPATRIYAIDELPQHPHLAAVGLFQPTEHPTEGAMVSIRPPTRFAHTPATLRLPAPLLGQHTFECLREAGVATADLERLAAQGVIRQAAPRA
ncbi:MAG: CoA transferase [Burkholderiales bacterium]|nr:CoA transferase [Burkholderiales bacterium]